MQGEPRPMNRDVVMKPAQRCEVIRVMITLVGSMLDVMHLEPIAAGASRYGAPLVAPRNKLANRQRDCRSGLRGHDGPPVLEPDQLHGTAAQDLFENAGSNSRSVLELCPKLTSAGAGQCEVDEYGSLKPAARACCGLV